MPQKQVHTGHRLPLAYNLFFLILEPASALVGAFYAHLRQPQYLHLLDASSSHATPPRGTSVVMSQLASMYLFFALNEAVVLRSTADMRVWRALLLVLLLADFAHLYALRQLGPRIYYDVTTWGAAHVGNVAWVYVGAILRLCFLAGVGMNGATTPPPSRKQ